ncbi:MAG: [FeFe] hydrogenase H-cluster maturation GTPase HydF [Lachnospiraceae bacterium]|nr:[FeFe] hydrogenase H-cluster maturation GTPase HydF [Lachnospiraceae bacterium]
MGLNDTPSAERKHIAFFGVRNAGKSSLVNKLTNQEMSLVSDVKGTTTDPVSKAMELTKAGPVLIIDTPGIDDTGELGEKRVERTRRILTKTDVAVLVTECGRSLNEAEKELIKLIKDREIPYITVRTKADLYDDNQGEEADNIAAENEANDGKDGNDRGADGNDRGSDGKDAAHGLGAKDKAADGTGKDGEAAQIIRVSSKTGQNIELLKQALTGLAAKGSGTDKHLVSDLLNEGDTVVLVIPIDESAPKGRLILPQQQTIRDILEKGCSAVVCRDTELASVLKGMPAPRMVITDSQAYGKVSKIVPEEIMLTSFSILFARYKGELESLKSGADKLAALKDGDKVLIAEGCTHHRQCNDIGSVKIPGWIRQYSKAEPEFHFSSGASFPEDLKEYSLIVHCGGCMLNESEMKYRISKAKEHGVPMVNYGMAIACMNGILERCLKVFDMQ